MSTSRTGQYFIPGSHRWKRKNERPPNAAEMLRPFVTKVDSIIALDARFWHTSAPISRWIRIGRF
ncbi:hypothetical protein BDW67DRAFT_161218 [Aspergillus spinulosporus]